MQEWPRIDGHSPMPWKAELREPYDFYVDSPDGHAIAKVYLDDGPVGDYNARQRANTRLMTLVAPHLCNVPGCPGPELVALIEAGWAYRDGR